MASEGCTGWSWRGTRSSGQVDKSEAWRGTKEDDGEREKEKSLNVTQEDSWAPLKILSSTKESLSATYKKNNDANTKVYDLNQKNNASSWQPCSYVCYV